MRYPRRPVPATLLALAVLIGPAGCAGAADRTAAGGPASSATGPTSGPTGRSSAASTGPTDPTDGSEPPEISSTSTPQPCSIFPADNVWHADVSRLPVHPNSAAIVASIGLDDAVHADFGSGTWDGGPIGIPITTIGAGQQTVKVSFEYAAESDPGPYPIPRHAKIEGGPNSDGDRHVIVLDKTSCRAYELFAAYPRSDGGWRAGSGAIFDLRANELRPRGWTSADAAGLSILAGLVRYQEVAAGHIDHAIRVTVARSADAYVWPARHSASDLGSADLPPMGLRLRLRAGVDISGLPRQARIVAAAMKKYGVIVSDNGSSWYISGTPDERWDNDALHALGALTGRDFEVVDTGGLMVSPNSAQARG